jgi:glycerate kinase
MTILIAPDSFKGTYSAIEVAEAVRTGLGRADAQAVTMPVADGGEGTLECLRRPLNLVIVTATVEIRGVAHCEGATDCPLTAPR